MAKRRDSTEAPPAPGPRGPAADKPDYRPALDGLRALAVGAVIAYHLGYADGGFLGVDLFFVISGYLITGLLVSEFTRTAQIAFLRFWARRIRRLYPALLLVICAVLVYGAVATGPLEQASLRSDALSSLFYFANWHFAAGAQSYFAQFAAPSPLRHIWSLAIEEQFYLVWPLVAAACLWLGRRRTWLLAAAAAVGAAASAALMAVMWNSVDPSAAYYSTLARAHELLIGALLALLLRRRAGRESSSLSSTSFAGIAALCVVAAFAVASDTTGAYYHGGSVAFCLAGAALIAGVERRGPNPIRDAFALGPVRYVGRISYALYLWHWPVILWITPGSIAVSGTALTLLRLVVMTAIASASTHLVEEPIRRGRVAEWLTPRRLAYLLPAVSVAMVAMTFALTRGTEPPATSASGARVAVNSSQGSQAAASPDARLASATAAPDPPQLHTVAIFGDSVPEMLKPYLLKAADRDGLRLVDAALGGCGVVAMTQTDAAGDVVSWQQTCDTIGSHERAVMAQFKPDAVVWFSGTENEPMLIDGIAYRPDTPQHEAALRRAMLAAHRRLTARGARLYLVELPPHGPPPGGCDVPQDNPQCAINATFNATVPYLNAQLRWLARRYRDTRLISLERLICPGGAPCPTAIDGVAVRPDGTHFSDAFAPRVAQALLGSLLARG